MTNPSRITQEVVLVPNLQVEFIANKVCCQEFKPIFEMREKETVLCYSTCLKELKFLTVLLLLIIICFSTESNMDQGSEQERR